MPMNVNLSWHRNYYSAPTNGSAWEPETGFDRVIRGGSADFGLAVSRSARRGYFSMTS